MFYRYVLCVPTLLTAIRSAKEAELDGRLEEWVCPQAVLIEPCVLESFREPRRTEDAADLFCKDPDFSNVLALVLLMASTVYVPICVGLSHWILVVLWLRTGVVEVYDSLGGSHLGLTRCVIRLLDLMCRKHEHNTIINTLGIGGWDIIQHGASSPQQTDGASCGVFVCVTGICISWGRPVVFSQREIMYWRLRIAFLLITNGAAVITATPPTHQRVVPIAEDPDGALVILSDSEEMDTGDVGGAHGAEATRTADAEVPSSGNARARAAAGAEVRTQMCTQRVRRLPRLRPRVEHGGEGEALRVLLLRRQAPPHARAREVGEQRVDVGPRRGRPVDALQRLRDPTLRRPLAIPGHRGGAAPGAHRPLVGVDREVERQLAVQRRGDGGIHRRALLEHRHQPMWPQSRAKPLTIAGDWATLGRNWPGAYIFPFAPVPTLTTDGNAFGRMPSGARPAAASNAG